jgi:alpha-glucosidase
VPIALALATHDVSAQVTTNAYDVATNYWNYSTSSGNFSGNQGFGFGAWALSTSGGGDYISNDGNAHPHSFGLWNSTADASSTAVRTFSSPLAVGESFSVQLEVNVMDNASNTNGFTLQTAGGNVLFSFYHQGGDTANGHYVDAGGSGTATGFTYNGDSFSTLTFTLNTATTYTFTDNTTGASFTGTLSGGSIAQVTFIRANGNSTPSNGQDLKFDTLLITSPIVAFDGFGLAYEGFNYIPGAVASQNGGFGWGGTWTNVAGNAMYFDLGNLLGYSNAPAGYDACSQGNHLCGYGGSRVGRLLDCSTNGFFGQNGYLNASGDIGAAGKTVYISFLEQPAMTASFYEFEFHRGDYGDPGRIAGIGNDTSDNDVHFRTPSGSFLDLGPGNGGVNLYVVRIDFNGGNDNVRVYRNPTSLTEPGTPTVTQFGLGDMSFDRLCVGAWGNYVAIDEIRVGTAWTNVIGLASAATGSIQSIAITNATMIGQGIAEFVPAGYNSNQVPSLSLVSEPISSGSLPQNWSLIPQFTLVNSNACASLLVPDGTSLYGGGEVNGPLLRNGQSVDIWATDTAGWSTDNLHRMYQAHPWVLGVRPDGTAFGVIFDSSYRAELTTGTNLITFESLGPLFRIFIIDRTSPQAVLQGLAQLTGTMPMPPEWALGYHQCRFSYAPASEVQAVAEGFLTNQIPCDAIWMDIGYMNNNRDFTIDPVGFPSMPSLTTWLHTNGFHAVNILDPAIAVDSSYSVYQSGTASNIWVQTARGSQYQDGSTPGNSSWPDFTMPAARTWWSGLCQNFLTNGMDGLWIDMDEPSCNNALSALNTMPYDNWHRAGGGLPAASHMLYHNAYGIFEAEATYQGELANNPNRRPFVLSRSNFLGGQRYAAAWTGDNGSTSNCMTVSIPMSLTLGLSGQPFSGPDLGGFAQIATPDLWGNWVGFGAFFPFCRGHAQAGTNQKEPWAFGPTVQNAAQIALQRRYRLLPYIYTLFYNSTQTGIPVMQPVFFANPADLSLRAEQQAFLLGSNLLVIPAWAQNPALPKGIWQPLSLVPGDAGQYQAHLEIRGGAILPVGPIVQHTTQNMLNPLTLMVCLDTNGFASGTLYQDAGDGWDFQTGNYSLQTFTAQQTGNSVLVKLSSQQGNYPVTNTSVIVEIVSSNGTFYASGSISSGITVAVAPQAGLAQTAFNAYNAAFLVRTNGLTYYQESVTNNAYAGSWVQALEIQVAEDAYDLTKSTDNQQLVSDLTTTFLARENYPWSQDTWNDDIAWMTIACVRGYQITGNTALLNQATNAWNMAYNRGWDSQLGGGIWENMATKDAKCALSNDPMIIAGAALYQITGQSTYLTKCQNIYTWVRNNLFNPTNGQIYEGINSNGTVMVSDNVYNSGAFINAANCLHNLTGATNFYQDALLAADHVVYNNAVLSNTGRGDSSWEDQFARGLADFAGDNQLWGLYSSWMAANANAAWSSRRPDLNITWNAWASPTTTNDCSSLECLSAAVIQQVIPPVTPNAPVFTLQPSNLITAVGNAVELNAMATNGQPIIYQWYHENNPILGATGTSLVLLSVTTSDGGNYWVVTSNSAASTFSQVATICLIGNTNGLLAQDSATNYTTTIGFTGNQGFGFGPWVLSTVGGGGYISGDSPPLFGLWNGTADSASTASRTFNLPLPLGGTFLVQLQMTTLDGAANQNGFNLQDASGNTLFSYWHQGGDGLNAHYSDAGGSGAATGFAYDDGQSDRLEFTLTSATTYTFRDLATGKSFSGRLSGAAISGVTFFRVNNSAATPSNGQDFKFSNLAITVVPMTPGPSPIAVGKVSQGWSFSFPLAPGYSYRLQRATNLVGPWTDIGTLTGPETGVGEFIDTNSPTAQSFYRTVAP